MLTRRIKIQGDNLSDQGGFGGHVSTSGERLAATGRGGGRVGGKEGQM